MDQEQIHRLMAESREKVYPGPELPRTRRLTREQVIAAARKMDWAGSKRWELGAELAEPAGKPAEVIPFPVKQRLPQTAGKGWGIALGEVPIELPRTTEEEIERDFPPESAWLGFYWSTEYLRAYMLARKRG